MSDNIKLINVRLSFSYIFEPREAKAGDDGKVGKPKYSATFMLDKKRHALLIKQVNAAIDQLVHDQWKGKLKRTALKNCCLHDGEEKEGVIDGYDSSMMFISTSSERRPPVVDRDRSPLTAADNRPYSGCYVNASIRLWVQDNKWGKGVNAELRAVQFVKDGEAFGVAPADPNAEFEDLGEDSSAFQPSDEPDMGESLI